MLIDTLNKIKIIENDHTLNILLLNFKANLVSSDILALANFGKTYVIVDSYLKVANLNLKLRNVENVNVRAIDQIPLMYYDIIISEYYDQQVHDILSRLNPKYLVFFNKISDKIENYHEFEENCFKKMVMIYPDKPVEEEAPDVKPAANSEIPFDEENISSNYLIEIKNLISEEEIYNKYQINYLKPIEPGKISLIMVVNEANNKFAETLRDIRNQKLASIEYIIIDNAAGFRNNVKADIKYGTKMPEDFCIYHAKELCSGEYMFIMNENSEPVDLIAEISKGRYETR